MKSLLLTATAVVFAAAVNLSPVSAAMPAGTAAGTPHYEWQYHYGKKARFEGNWVLERYPV
jgi:hypothetical protein